MQARTWLREEIRVGAVPVEQRFADSRDRAGRLPSRALVELRRCRLDDVAIGLGEGVSGLVGAGDMRDRMDLLDDRPLDWDVRRWDLVLHEASSLVYTLTMELIQLPLGWLIPWLQLTP